MIDELEIIKGIVGDLSGVGIYVMIGYVLMRILTVGAWLFFGVTLITFIFNAATASFGSVSTSEHSKTTEIVGNLKREIALLTNIHETEISIIKSKCKIEVEEIKHLYKILKEASNSKQ